MKIKLLLFLVFSIRVILVSHAQNALSFIIQDSSTGMPVPFVHVSVPGKNLGAVSNEAGAVLLKNIEGTDSIYIYTIGYYDRKLSIKNVGGKTLFLSPRVYILTEVTISAVGAKTKIDKKKMKPSKTRFCSRYGPGYELVRYFSAPEQGDAIASVFVFLFAGLEEKEEKIRLRIYRPNASDKPGENILPKSIIVPCGKKKGWVTMDIRELHITVPETGFFVGIEFLNNAPIQEDRICVGLSEDSDANTTWIKNVGQFWHQLDFLKSPKNKQLNLMAVVEYL
jgi:hypothetical protein